MNRRKKPVSEALYEEFQLIKNAKTEVLIGTMASYSTKEKVEEDYEIITLIGFEIESRIPTVSAHILFN